MISQALALTKRQKSCAQDKQILIDREPPDSSGAALERKRKKLNLMRRFVPTRNVVASSSPATNYECILTDATKQSNNPRKNFKYLHLSLPSLRSLSISTPKPKILNK